MLWGKARNSVWLEWGGRGTSRKVLADGAVGQVSIFITSTNAAWETSCRGGSWGAREPLAMVQLKAAVVGRRGWILGVLLAVEAPGSAIRDLPWWLNIWKSRQLKAQRKFPRMVFGRAVC